MLRKDFKSGMVRIKNRQEMIHCYCCNLIEIYLGKKARILYKEIINGEDSDVTGMFDRTVCHNTEGHAARKLSLEIFERVVLDEKLWKGL